MKDQVSTLLRKLPHVAKFNIIMAADSTTEVWVDIQTHLNGSDGWHFVRLEFDFEIIPPTVPLNGHSSAATKHVLQMHRNIEHETLLPQNDDDVVFTISKVLASNYIEPSTPFSFDLDEVTTQPKLRLLFRTAADNTYISATNVQLAGRLYYHKLNGPNVGHTKLGRIKEF